MDHYFRPRPTNRFRSGAHTVSRRPTTHRKLTNRSGYIDINRFINTAIVQEQVEAYHSTHTFDDFGLDPRLVNNLKARGYVHPTPIQDQAIKPVLAGKDLIGLANTGTGKTAAFLLPILDHSLKGSDTGALVVVPTRELATQIMDEFLAFSGNLSLHATVVVGGESMQKQIKSIQRNPDLIIGTPGRLKDLIKQRKLRLDNCQTFVLDEVDRMLDMGFITDIKELIALLPTKRQSLFFSATLNKELESLAQSLLSDPLTVSVRTSETSDHVEQDVVYIASKEQKEAKLEELLRRPDFSKVLVFGGTKWGVEKISTHLRQNGFKVAAIHGNKSQPQRQRALDDFKANKIQALIATDVAARGIDIPKVTHVINFDIPHTYDEYVHRIGRTGRAGQTGVALTFVPASAQPKQPAMANYQR